MGQSSEVINSEVFTDNNEQLEKSGNSLDPTIEPHLILKINEL